MSIYQLKEDLKLVVKFILWCVLVFNVPGNNKKCAKCRDYLKTLKNIHNGERCFIIGNGPSLTVEDLDRLKEENEICFASNRIFNLFDKTDWRPTYYCITDAALLRRLKDDIPLKIQCEKFAGINNRNFTPDIEGVNYFDFKCEKFWPGLPKFSEDVSECCYEGKTVTYACFQIAAYMGFKEIYLLGVDNSYSVSRTLDGRIIKNPGASDHFYENKDNIMPSTELMDLAYEAAKKYSDEHNIKIYNATRGGKLEIFERVNFDELF